MYKSIVSYLERIDDESNFETSEDKPAAKETDNFLNIKKCPERSTHIKISKEKVKTYSWDNSNSIEFISNIMRSSEPAVIKNIPKKLFGIFEIDFKVLASKGLKLDETKWVPDGIYISSNDREPGGMIGSKKGDKPVLFSNITLYDFLRSIISKNNYFFW